MALMFDAEGGCSLERLFRVTWVEVLVSACLVFVGGGCSSTGDDASSPSGSTQVTSHQELVQTLDEQLGDVLHREAHRRAWSTAIVDGLQSAEADDPLEIEHRSLLDSTYARYDYTGRWFQITSKGYRLSSSGRTLLERLERGVDRHGLWPDDLHVFQLREPLVSGERPETELSWSIRLALTDRERRKLQGAIDEHNDGNGEEADLETLASLVADPEGPTPRLARAVGEATSQIRDEARRVARFELLLSDALATYAIEMRYGNSAWHRPRAWRATLRLGETGPLRSVHLSGEEKKKPTAAERMQRAIRTARIRTLTAEMFVQVWEEGEAIAALMESVQPPYRQYERLTRAFRQYRTVVERGGWPEVDPFLQNLGIGSSHASVTKLKQRLALEGYFPKREEFSPHFTSELKSALTTYQRTHQIWDAGSVTGPTIRSLNVSAERRWHQLRLALERWRNSQIGADRHYVHVNIPDYHAELWRNGTREMRFRVVVGSSDQPEEDESDEDGGDEASDEQDDEQDEEDEEEDEPKYPRATPRFSGTLEYVVLNPYWNVPHAIWQNEIKPKKEEENPDLYDEKGYEVVTDDNGHRFLRQKPGPKNALGRVKFLFPNDHSVYMHDTNEPFLFEQPVRDYSHGCIRVQKPMELLNYLLDLDGRWTGERRKELLKKWFDQKEERWLKLRESIPVHIEYIVARVGDEGRAHFGADIYDIDQPKLEEIEKRMDELPGAYDLPPLDYTLRLEATLDGDFQREPTL